MITEEETRRVVEGYFAAWTSNKVDEAYALLADDLAFWGPTPSYQSAAAFRPALAGFAAMTKRAQVTELVVQGDRGAALRLRAAAAGRHDQDCVILPRRERKNPLVRDAVRRHRAAQATGALVPPI
jgi:ketosteroid isomerase-like protein